jgi:hypothetical protein
MKTLIALAVLAFAVIGVGFAIAAISVHTASTVKCVHFKSVEVCWET